MSLGKFIDSVITVFLAVSVKRSGDNYKKSSHNSIVANKPIKKDWSK
ncbi:hypothetical protein [Streptococcus oralis]|nr:hypothetical protein [Streptococcus oralis]